VPESIVLLHGFGGTRHAWDGVVAHLDAQRYRPLALDLPGHGDAADAPGPLTFAGCVEHVLERAPASFTLAGYSLGGRIALQMALAAPAGVARLVLVSSTAGIEDAGERERRRAADEQLARELETTPYEQFIERWRSQPLFADEPPDVDALARADQRRNDPQALAEVLRGIGPGEMAPLWNRLRELTMPVTVIAGERDASYRAIGERMAAGLPRGRFATVPGGHAVALESPRAVARLI